MKKLFFVLLLMFSFACKDSPPAKSEPTQSTACVVQRVIDGDTFECLLEDKEEVKVRLIGVDTPESRPNPKLERDVQKSSRSTEEIIKMGKRAKEFTKSLLPRGSKVYLEFDVQRTDRYGRLLAYVWLSDGRMLNEVLVREGYAQVYTIPPNVKYQERLLQAQRRAREEGKGFWGKGGF